MFPYLELCSSFEITSTLKKKFCCCKAIMVEGEFRYRGDGAGQLEGWRGFRSRRWSWREGWRGFKVVELEMVLEAAVAVARTSESSS